jgi:hypothetical protein
VGRPSLPATRMAAVLTLQVLLDERAAGAVALLALVAG